MARVLTPRRIADLMTDRIRAYFCSLGHEPAEAEDLHTHYYKEYGLAIRGLVKHHEIDALDYDAKCDASLPLESILHPDKEAIALFEQLSPEKCRVYALTNAYKHVRCISRVHADRQHAQRVLRLLGLDRLVEAVVYCDYVNPGFACKPERVFYDAAMAAIQAPQGAPVYFVDDSAKNVHAAQELGWKSCGTCRRRLATLTAVLFDEKAVGTPRRSADGLMTIARLAQLRELWPELFT